MASRLPSLNGLYVFETAARHLSFTKAAEELFVTQTAVSHQISRLEKELGVKLFRRDKSGLALTAAGEAFLPKVRSAFQDLRLATSELEGRRNNNTLTISTLVSLASKWLIPKLPQFHARYPNIDVQISASTELIDFSNSRIDAAIRYGDGAWPGLRADWLMEDRIFPVCSPWLLSNGPPLSSPADLAQHTLLQVSGMTSGDWGRWLNAAGVPTEPLQGHKLTFDLALMAVQAAIDGLGVCIGRKTYVAADLKAGRLVMPFDLQLKSQASFYLVSPEETANCSKVTAFRNWLIESAQQD